MAIALDIETIQNENFVNLLPQPEVKFGNTKDEKKLEEKVKEAKAKQIEKMALHPETGMIASYAAWDGKTMRSNVLKDLNYSSEIELINEIFDIIAIGSLQETIVTYNGTYFDFPYIYKRAMINRVEIESTSTKCVPKLDYWTKKYSVHPHCDLMNVWSGYDRSNTSSLDYLGCLLLGEGKTERDYSKYLSYIKEGKQDIILRDNECDSKITYRLYKKLNGYLF